MGTITIKWKNKEIFVKRPKWKLVYEGYPKTGAGEDIRPEIIFTTLFALKDYTKDQANLANACATRVSLGLINGGIKLKKIYQITNPKLPYNNPKFKEGVGFVVRADHLKDLLLKPNYLGEPDVTINKSISLDEVRKVIGSKNGIYIITDCFGGGVTGHATLWVGKNQNVIGGHNYADYGGKIFFWELR